MIQNASIGEIGVGSQMSEGGGFAGAGRADDFDVAFHAAGDDGFDKLYEGDGGGESFAAGARVTIARRDSIGAEDAESPGMERGILTRSLGGFAAKIAFSTFVHQHDEF